MTDGNTYAINKYLDEREDYDALQEVTAELEQAEARIEELEAKLAMADQIGHMKVTDVFEHEDGSATITFDIDDAIAALAQELGLKLLVYCGATGTDLDCVFDSILGRGQDDE